MTLLDLMVAAVLNTGESKPTVKIMALAFVKFRLKLLSQGFAVSQMDIV